MNARRGFLARMLLAPLAAQNLAEAVEETHFSLPNQAAVAPPTDLEEKLSGMWEKFYHDDQIMHTYELAAADAASEPFKAAPAWRKGEIVAAARAKAARRQYRQQRAMQARVAAVKAVGL